jgi:hypothetical protein
MKLRLSMFCVPRSLKLVPPQPNRGDGRASRDAGGIHKWVRNAPPGKSSGIRRDHKMKPTLMFLMTIAGAPAVYAQNPLSIELRGDCNGIKRDITNAADRMSEIRAESLY